MNFYTVNGSPNCRKVHAVINQLGLDVQICELDFFAGELNTPEFQALNPNGMVPVLEDGSLRLWESNAIMQYLAAIGPANDLYPADHRIRADIHRWQNWEQAHYNRAVGTFVFENVLKTLMELGEPDQAKLDQAKQDFYQFANVLEQQLADKAFITGDQLSLADFSVASMADFLDAAEVPYHAYPNIRAWLKRLDAIPAWAETPKLAA